MLPISETESKKWLQDDAAMSVQTPNAAASFLAVISPRLFNAEILMVSSPTPDGTSFPNTISE
jgi:hypothetical protein